LSICSIILLTYLTAVNIQYDAKVISQSKLVKTVHELESSIAATTNIKIPCREIHLPAVFEHPDIQASTQRYMETNRPTAAYLPDNIEYLRINNGLSTRRQVFDTLLNSPFLVVAVGFLVGTPILFPLSPLSGIVGQKYNPTRVSTPGGTIGMGGSLFAIYPVEAPGGYMLVARTMEAWDTFGLKPDYAPDRPWLFESFDLVKYHEVSVAEYDQLTRDFKSGNYHYDIREAEFDLQAVVDVFTAAKTDPAVVSFKAGQADGVKMKVEEERRKYGEWVAEQETQKAREAERLKEMMTSEPAVTIDSPIDANVWKVLVEPGDVLRAGQTVAILEAMKMEINVVCTEEAVGTTVEAIASQPGTVVSPGTWIVVSKREEVGNGAEEGKVGEKGVDESGTQNGTVEEKKGGDGKVEKLSLKERVKAKFRKA
jgi:urea carboxylase